MKLQTAVGDLIAVGDTLDEYATRARIGWHVTDLIKIRSLLAHPDAEPRIYDFFHSGNHMPNWVRPLGAIGKIWEYAILYHYTHTQDQDTQVDSKVDAERDGVTGSLDGMIHTSSGSLVIECKCRFGSPGEDPRSYRDWMPQTMAYCKMVDTTEVLMPVLYIPNSRQVTFLQHRITFSEGELTGNWSTLISSRDRVTKMGYTPDQIPHY